MDEIIAAECIPGSRQGRQGGAGVFHAGIRGRSYCGPSSCMGSTSSKRSWVGVPAMRFLCGNQRKESRGFRFVHEVDVVFEIAPYGIFQGAGVERLGMQGGEVLALGRPDAEAFRRHETHFRVKLRFAAEQDGPEPHGRLPWRWHA